MAISKLVWKDKEILKKIDIKNKRRLKQIGKIVEEDAKRACPVGSVLGTRKRTLKAWKEMRPGLLRDSIRSFVSRYSNDTVIVRVGGYKTYYWSYVELGHPGRSAVKFMRNSLDKNIRRIRQIYNKPMI